jgi:recombination protein RecA
MAKGPQAAAMARFQQKFTKSYGDGHNRTGDDIPAGIDAISTGSLLLDYRLGIGGLPVGRSSELWGVPGSCKTTTALLAIGEAQRKFPDRYAAFIDVENSFDRRWAELHGVNIDQLQLFDGFDYAEDYCDVLYDIVQSPLFSICVMDSIGALTPREEFEKKAAEATVGTKAKLITRAVHKVAPTIRRTNMAMVYINQIRAIVSAMGGSTTGGGFGLKHVSSVQGKYTEGQPKQTKVDGEMISVGKEITVRTKKNKLAPPEQVARPVFFQQASAKFGPPGVDRASEAFQLGRLLGLFERAGNNYILPSGAKNLGEEKTIDYLRNEPAEVEDLRQRALATVADTVRDDLPELERTEAELDPDKVAAETVGAA